MNDLMITKISYVNVINQFPKIGDYFYHTYVSPLEYEEERIWGLYQVTAKDEIGMSVRSIGGETHNEIKYMTAQPESDNFYYKPASKEVVSQLDGLSVTNVKRWIRNLLT